IKIEEWLKKKIPVLGNKDRSQHLAIYKKILERGTRWDCNNCLEEWKSKPEELFDRCPKCGSNKVSFRCGIIDSRSGNEIGIPLYKMPDEYFETEKDISNKK